MRRGRNDEYEQDYEELIGGFVEDEDIGGFREDFSERAAAAHHTRQVQAKKTKKKRRKRGWLVALIVVLALVAGGVLFWKIWVRAPHTGGYISDGNTEDAVAPANLSAGRKPGCYTFLIAGKDKAAGLTDTVLVGMLDTKNHTLRFVSIPRDTAVNISWAPKKVNQYYAAAENNGKDGVEALLSGVEKLLGYRVDSYAIFDVEVFVELVDTMGGVYFDVPIDMNYDDPLQELWIHVNKGYQLLNGYDTMCVFRYRSTYPDGDIGRINVQHDLLMSICSQMLSLGNIPNIGKLVDLYEREVITNISKGNVMYYVQEFLKLSDENIVFDTVPANYGGSKNGLSYVFIHKDEWLDYINTYLNPYTEDITDENVDIIYETSDGSVAATSGTINGNDRW